MNGEPFEAVLKLVMTGAHVHIADFGTFKLVTLKPKRVVFNDGRVKVMPAKRVLKFVAVKALRNIEAK